MASVKGIIFPKNRDLLEGDETTLWRLVISFLSTLKPFSQVMHEPQICTIYVFLSERNSDMRNTRKRNTGGTLCIRVQISWRDTWYPWTDLLTKSVLVGTHVCCLLSDRRKSSFIPFVHGETKTKLVRLWKTPGVFPPKIRLPSTINTIPVPEPRQLNWLSTSFKSVSLHRPIRLKVSQSAIDSQIIFIILSFRNHHFHFPA